MYRLAAQLGYPSVDKMTDEMSSTEITEWMAFYKMEPFGFDRVEYLLGMFMTMYASANRGKRGRKPKQKDFMPFMFKKMTEEQELEAFFGMYQGFRDGNVTAEEIEKTWR